MKKMNSKIVLTGISVISILLGMFLATISFHQGYKNGSNFAYAQSALKDNPVVQKALETQNAFSLVAKSIIPTVVNISSEIVVKQQFSQNDPFFRFFGKDWFDFFFQDNPSREYVQQALGSGVIIDEDGNILTNYHVIKDATRIKVKLSNGKEYKAKIIGVDPKTDLALIKIDADEKLPKAPIGDSDKLEVGHWAIAIGNPFGLNQTFTVGVVSAKGRSGILQDSSRYENYIQTDAPINPGNSGGPLVNIEGEVIGINSAIASPSGGNVGIGFAIPINMAKAIFEQLKTKGKVTRGWIGVSIQDLTPELAKFFKREANSGVLVSDVFKKSPAEKAGLQSGDIILEYNGKEIKDTNQLRNAVAETKPGTTADLKILRKNDIKKLSIRIEEMADEKPELASKPGETWIGLVVDNITPDNIKNFQLQDDEKGVVIINVQPNSQAQMDGLKPGDVIKQINNIIIENTKGFNDFVEKYKKEVSFLLIVKREGRLFYLTLDKNNE